MSNSFMRRAIELALDNLRTGRGGPFAAVVVKEGKILAEGVNCVTPTKDPTAHAEIVAIRGACAKLRHFQLDGCEIYTTCEPCPMCLGAIYWARPARVFYACTAEDAAEAGFDDSFIYDELCAPVPQRRIRMIQTMREEALRIFDAWRAKEDKVHY